MNRSRKFNTMQLPHAEVYLEALYMCVVEGFRIHSHLTQRMPNASSNERAFAPSQTAKSTANAQNTTELLSQGAGTLVDCRVLLWLQ